MAINITNTAVDTLFSTPAASFSVALPATVSAGDLIVIACEAAELGKFMQATGWTSSWKDLSTSTFTLLHKIADGTEGGTSITVSTDDGGTTVLKTAVFTLGNVNQTTQVGNIASGVLPTAAATVTIPTGTLTVADGNAVLNIVVNEGGVRTHVSHSNSLDTVIINSEAAVPMLHIYMDSVVAGTTTPEYSSTYNDTRAFDWLLFEINAAAPADTTAPVLTNPSVTPAWKSATTTFDTDTGEGTASAIYYLATDPDPTAAEVDGNSYANTVAHVSVAVSAAGTVTLPDPAGLAPNTAYKVKPVHKDIAGNIGELNPVSFTTLSASMSATIGSGANLTALEYRVQDGASLVGADIKTGADASTDAAGNLIINLDDVNVTDGQQVYYVIADAADTHIAGGVATVSIA